MRIVIIGEFSGFAKNLKEGFKRLGHTPFIYSWGDGFKKIDSGKDSYTINVCNYTLFGKKIKGSNRIRSILSALKLRAHLDIMWRKKKADAVLIINTAFLKTNHNAFSPYFSYEMIRKISSQETKIFLSACGNDYIFNRYLPFCKKTNEFAISKCISGLKIERNNFLKYLSFVNEVIPVMADYALAYRHFNTEFNYHVLSTIPLPFDVSSVKVKNYFGEKIIVMHGITRPFEKGSYIILAALEKLKKKYEDKVDVKIVERVALDEYLKIMEEANIIVDQCYSYGYGMNAIEALSMGKVVLSGNEEENQREFGIIECPVINIKPNADYIYDILSNLISNPDKIKEISHESRIYAESIHDARVVAQRYIEMFNS